MRPRSPILALAVMAAAPAWTACTVGANYSRPPMPSPAQYRFVNGPEAESLADVPWFEVFQDPSLQALIREALANNLDLRAAAARVEEARARAGIVKSFLYPQVDGVAQTTVGQASTALSGEDDEDNTRANGVFGFQLSWELDLFGRIRREHESSLAFVLASDYGRRGIIVTLIGDVATNYFLLRELDLQLEIARRTLRLNDETVLYFQNRLDGGVSNRLELDRIRALRS
ncbi:MAG TPA: TolC family protein, partial [Pyrinomonadaceae bacterium]|nr:TolC family protein [Pyrinomonadaceae bacterium]